MVANHIERLEREVLKAELFVDEVGEQENHLQWKLVVEC